jgi:hypothetical protein
MRKLQLLVLSLGVIIFFVLLSKQPIQEIKPEIENDPIPESVKPKIELPKKTSPDEAIEKISKEELKKNLEYLASNDLEGRMSGKKGNKLAAEFVKKKFEEMGLSTEYHKFPIKRVNPGPKNEIGDDFTQNVYAWIEGNDPQLKNEIVVVGAHLDHIGYGPSMSRWGGNKVHPGADDNASGTVALLEIAKAFAALKDQNKRTIVFMAFSAEEMGLKGSIHYVNNPQFPRDNPDIKKHVFMLNMDMIGYLGQSKSVVFNDGSSSPDVGAIIDSLSKKYLFAKNITLRGTSGSDHAPFYNKKVPVAFLHTGLHDHYHTPRDSAEKINYEGLVKVTRYGFDLAWHICNDASKPEFDYGAFQEMNYNHDHGQPEVPFEEKP